MPARNPSLNKGLGFFLQPHETAVEVEGGDYRSQVLRVQSNEIRNWNEFNGLRLPTRFS